MLKKWTSRNQSVPLVCVCCILQFITDITMTMDCVFSVCECQLFCSKSQTYSMRVNIMTEVCFILSADNDNQQKNIFPISSLSWQRNVYHNAEGLSSQLSSFHPSWPIRTIRLYISLSCASPLEYRKLFQKSQYHRETFCNNTNVLQINTPNE